MANTAEVMATNSAGSEMAAGTRSLARPGFATLPSPPQSIILPGLKKGLDAENPAPNDHVGAGFLSSMASAI